MPVLNSSMQTMSCLGSIACSTNSSILDDVYSYSNNDDATTTNFSLLFTADSPHATGNENVSKHELPKVPDMGEVTVILSFSVLVFVCCCLALLSTSWTEGGRGATLVFLRSLCISDILMSTYGISKMTMLLFLDQLSINFFLPESLFFTASFASTMSLLFLNVDCFMKLTRPLHYIQTDKDTIITVMLLMWNAAFIVGFLPLIGWNQEDNTVHFFSFYPWHYLFFNGCINLICVVVCIACTMSLKRFRTFCHLDYDYFSTQMLEVRNYKHLHRTIIVDSIIWLCCYIPFFMYIALTCPQCPLSDYPYRDSAIIYFIPIFMVKSLCSSVLQACRTLNTHAFISTFISKTSLFKYLRDWRREKKGQPKDAGVAAISFSNPLCDYVNSLSNRENHVMRAHNQYTRHHRFSEVELIQGSGFYSSLSGSSTSLTGINNTSFRPHIEAQPMVGPSQETTVL